MHPRLSRNAPRYNYPEPLYPSIAPNPPGPSPPYVTNTSETGAHHDAGDVAPSEAPPIAYGPPTADLLGPPPAREQRAPSPARTQFEAFVSPFEALANTSGAKRKPPPSQQPSMQSSAEEFSFPSLTIDPKRKSVENLMEQLTRGQAPQPASVQQQQQFPSYDPYAPSDDLMQQAEPAQARASRPLPPQPAHAPSPPRASPPKQQVQVRQQQRRSAESPLGPVAYGPAPGSGTGYRNGGSEGSRRGGIKNKNISPR